MRGRLLVALVLSIAITSLAQANYVVIIANLNAQNESGTGTGGLAGGPGGLGGLPGRGMGGPSGSGMGGLGPSPGGGSFTGGSGGFTGGRGMSGPPGASGGFPGGMMGGGMPGMGGYGNTADADSDDDSYIVVAVIDVGTLSTNKLKNFESGLYDKLGSGMPFSLGRWGGKINLKQKTAMYEVIPLKHNGALLNDSLTRFNVRKNRLGATASAEEKIDLARHALEYDLLREFTLTMDELVESAKDNPIVQTYVKTKQALERPVTDQNAASTWKNRLLEQYRIYDGAHYALIHNYPPDTTLEVKAVSDRLEQSFQAFYYWWALRGISLPVPSERQIAILTEKTDDFKRLNKHLTASQVVTDSFFARREGIAVIASKRNDDSYATLDRQAKPLWDKGYVRAHLLQGNPKSGLPRSMWPQLLSGQPIEEAENARLYALLLKALEEEWEAAGISHQVSRQLIYASKLLPRNVNAPEWIGFGLGSFFEIPLQSPFGGVGAPSPYWLPRFRESYKAKQYNKDPNAKEPSAYDALIQVVSDEGFRSLPPPSAPRLGETPEMTARRIKEAHQRRARAAAWSLTFFLAKQDLQGLQRYLHELSLMPRDVELDQKVLLNCFARAFNCVNLDKSINRGRMTNLAERWIRYVNSTQLEAEGVHEKIREYYKRVTRVQPQSSGTGQPGGGRPGFPAGPGGRGFPGTGDR